ncbi:M20/M25/M40 family metallo-hydrolase [Sphingomonas sp. BN140010]|uniref:M20/M25/M40 family metallo-hydrolase n=1 Tax=Sphingomonas arvum TaxID=2992113 RepID=A0ABT3JDE4_9SPHN|nr:M20/M25/M40 family metallo-hydrolase [Sphingomonas sp. BN140010]MCW3797039.1 M20/M25/M40 family metallo-hydrolase [Sphingomonas sp. BN140010]
MRKSLWLVLVVAGLLALMAATPWLSAPPAVRTLSAAGEFDALRAKDRLARVLGEQRPHPADTVASDEVRDRLVAELRSMGLQPRVDDRFACNRLFKQRGVSCARVRNVLVTVGPANGRHLLINSHYDSVPVGPGASDAGMGVATMLEVASLLRDRPLGRPVTFLFNEGEELGLVGARAFLEGDPLNRQVDSLINLEARGTTGPVNMFETSVPNAAAVRVFAETVRAPVASSLAVSAYKQIPNYTDVNTFEDRRWLTLNFAPIGNETRYHSPGDDLAGMDPATLQHMGDQVLSVASRLASRPAPVASGSGSEILFMTMAPFGLVTMPMWVGVVAAAGLGIVLLIAVVRRRAWLAVPALLVAVVGGAAVAWLGLSIVGALREGQFWRAQPAASELAVYAGVIAVGLALVGLMRRTDIGRLRAGFWLLFVALGAGLTALASGALIYFILPPAVFALGLLAARWWKPAETVAAVLAAIVLYLTLGGMLGLLEDLLNSGPLWLFAIFGALVLLPWLIEAKPLLEGARRGRLLAALAGFAALAWVPAALAPAYSADRQQQWTLQYVVDPAQRQPVWSVVNDRKALPAAWRRFGDWRLGTVEALGRRQRWIAPAPPVGGLMPARALAVEATSAPGGRRVQLRIQANGADSVSITAPANANVRALGVPGQVRAVAAKEGSGVYSLTCTGRSCDGQIVELLIGPEPVQLTVVGTRWALPAAAAPLKAAQPRFARAQYLPDATVLISRLRL